MEMDPFRVGETVASNVISYLKTGRYPTEENFVEPTWFDGETMWRKPRTNSNATNPLAGAREFVV